MSDNSDTSKGGNSGQFVRHAVYWYTDGSIVVRVDPTTIYKIHLSMLTRLSEVMGSILTIPESGGKAPDDPTREGTEHYPLLLPGTCVEEFDDFLHWLYRTEWEPLGRNDIEKERICTHLLKLSDMWQIRPGKTYAISVLENMDLPASRRLELAGRFTIADWVKPAVKKILNKNLGSLTDHDIRAMGWKVYSILVKAKEMLDAETRRTAFVPPAMTKDPAWECKEHSSCLSVWPKLWFDKIGRELLHADRPIQLNEIAGKVLKDDTLKHARLSESCRIDMVNQCFDMTFADDGIITACAEAIVKYHADLL
ncbi:hypothetical protein C8F04DRAFT_1193114 [Mycena alexandri]|uniref:BTB domain-containing protein n=1 Tax=Mycena alexandri TaxID=1745969 RepID=A0AAD6SAS3_9AGAR|nr:hypothetical protein C8F04DRAFT_1193114 [Mycena alexandri]